VDGAVVDDGTTGLISGAGTRGIVAAVLGFALAAYALYWVVGIVDPHVYRVTFLMVAIVLTMVAHPSGSSKINIAWDVLWIALTIGAFVWPLLDIEAFVNRAATPNTIDIAAGVIALLVVLESTRRTTGWVLPVTALVFLAYAVAGPLLDRIGLDLIAHRGYGIARLIGTIYMTLEGIFGVPLDVATTYIVLFTIYGAILEHSGAGKFFVDWTTAAIGRSGKGAGPGRTVTAAGYLLGAVSGSGVANTVMLGAVTWPLMKRAGYPADTAGAVLAAAGIGAILAPPVMGAAAFLIAEFLHISYLEVIVTAAIPAALYYLSIFLMVEADSGRLGLRPIETKLPTLGVLTKQGWFHFASIASIVILMLQGFTTFRSVFWAMVLAVGLSFLNRKTALTPRRLAGALSAGGRGVLPVAATTAAAGIIVGVVTLTGLGLKVAGLIVALAGGNLLLTILYAGIAVWMLGLAVPVTASYIIAAVMVVPALVQVGVAELAAHMFVFYYAVLSEVSPPTALSPFAAAAITGGSPFRTTMLSWKYTAPAFVVPFAFTIDARGLGLLLHSTPINVLWSTVAAVLALVALAAAANGWMRTRVSPVERGLAAVAAILLFVPRLASTVTGGALLVLLAARQWRGESGSRVGS
jgi:TRAP transporter 4TM/12TM fusion protein